MNIKATKVFERNYNSTKKIVVNRGGTRSGKTYSILQLILVWLYSWRIDNSWKVFDSGLVTVVRKQKSTLKATAIRDWEEIIVENDLWFLLDKEHRNKTDKTYTYEWRTVEFIWADDQQKLRWGKRDILYCNEANELVFDQEFFQLLMRTTYKVIIDFNPDNEYIRINTELEQKRQHEEWDVEIIISTYKDNPFLPEIQVKEIERLEKTNPRYWKVYWLWEYGKLEWIIFPEYTQVSEVPKEANFVWYWLDFWHTNDPTALVALRQYDWRVIMDEIFYEYWLTNLDIDAKITSLWLDKRSKFIADSAEPKSIEELYRCWINVKGVKKGKDSIVYWIDLMCAHKLSITSWSYNFLRDFRSYTRDKDKEWRLINKPCPWLDHWIDACRYVFMELLVPRKRDRWSAIQAKR